MQMKFRWISETFLQKCVNYTFKQYFADILGDLVFRSGSKNSFVQWKIDVKSSDNKFKVYQ